MKNLLLSTLSALTIGIANLSQSGCILLFLDEPEAPSHMQE